MGKKNKSLANRIAYYILLIILLILLVLAYKYYQNNNFNDFTRCEEKIHTSQFKRDKKIKYSKNKSYEIDSPKFNDAMFYKTIKVNKEQSYKVTCMVKTENVEAEKNNSGIGAQISVEGTTERSTAISGTEDWQKIELIFNSKNRDEINVGFRLGGYLGNAKGKAWFSDFTIEEGEKDTSNEWKFACFILKNTDVNINGKEIKLEVTQNDISDITNTIGRFENTCRTLSKGKMTAKCDTYIVNTPLTTLSYDEEFAYFVSAEDVEGQIKDTILQNNYDHIFVIVRLRR